MDPDKLRKAALDLGASDGRLLLQMGIYDAVQVAKEALQRLAFIDGQPRGPLEEQVAVNADLVDKNRLLREKVEQLQNFVDHGDKLQIADLKATLDRVGREKLEVETLLDEKWTELKEFRTRLREVLKPVGVERGLLDIELAAVRTQELAAARAKIHKLEAGIAAYRKRSAEINKLLSRQDRDLDDADAWETSLIDVDGQPTQET